MAREKLLSVYTTACAPGVLTIAHPQLRDLIVCPSQQGVIQYVSNKRIMECNLSTRTDRVVGQLTFEPNCLTYGCGILGAGGSAGELWLTAPGKWERTWSLPSPASINNSLLVTKLGDYTRLFVSNNDMTLKVYNVNPEKGDLEGAGVLGVRTPVNHASISPDGKTLLAVGDTNDVFLHNIAGIGDLVNFEKISTYKAGLDANFSTAWSSDGRKFAVACQDGSVTVWDTRSSKPLSYFRSGAQPSDYRSPTRSSRRGVSPPRVLQQIRSSQHFGDEYDDEEFASVAYPSLTRTAAMMMEPRPGPWLDRYETVVTEGEPGKGEESWDGSASGEGKNATRVLRFSPDGAARDVLVFTEDSMRFHVVDAQTFNEHVVVTVPQPAAESEDFPHLAGVAFDPKGDHLYVGSHQGIFEWEIEKGNWDRGYANLA